MSFYPITVSKYLICLIFTKELSCYNSIMHYDRTCKKLQRLVGDREVWVTHLQGIAQFTKEVVEKLAIFGTNGSPEMMSEVLTAVASRMG